MEQLKNVAWYVVIECRSAAEPVAGFTHEARIKLCAAPTISGEEHHPAVLAQAINRAVPKAVVELLRFDVAGDDRRLQACVPRIEGRYPPNAAFRGVSSVGF